jgi:HK97 family phage portal protein
MSLLDKIFRPKKWAADQYFHTLTAYEPVFKKWRGEIYESELVRAAIDAVARHVSKLTIKVHGAAMPKTQTILKKKPNEFMTWSQFLYRALTILYMQNTLFIVPIIDINNDVVGIWPCLPEKCKVLESKNGRLYLEYTFTNHQAAAVELDRCGIMTRFQYRDDFFGESNLALEDTLDLIGMERQGIKEGVKSASTFRFLARATNFKDPEDLAQEQKNFTARNMRADASGFLLFPNTYDGIQQIHSSAYTVSADEQALIQRNVFDYFGVSEDVIQNKASGSALDALFDGCIEPFAIQLEQVLTFMLFTDLEIGHGAKVEVAANRLQYMSTTDKINFIAQLSDRGMITINEARELINYSALPPDVGDLLPIRGEYYFVGDDRKEVTDPAPLPENTQPEAPAEGEENVDQE